MQRVSYFSLAAITAAVSLGSILLVRESARPEHGRNSFSFLKMFMGDSRRLFANYFFTKADVYLHGGFYPTVFDEKRPKGKTTVSEYSTTRTKKNPEGDDPDHDHDGDGKPDHAPEQHSGSDRKSSSGPARPAVEHDHDGDGKPDHAPGQHAAEGHEKEMDFLGKPRTWIDRFGRNFFPSQHRHLESVQEREILPWFRISAQLDPNRVETYTVAAYFLRQRLGKAKEAEQFLREGLLENPGSYEILFELGRLAEENHQDLSRARNIYELAWKRWQEKEAAKPEPDIFVRQQILSHLAGVEEATGNTKTAIAYWEAYKIAAVHKPKIQEHIDGLTAGLGGNNKP